MLFDDKGLLIIEYNAKNSITVPKFGLKPNWASVNISTMIETEVKGLRKQITKPIPW